MAFLRPAVAGSGLGSAPYVHTFVTADWIDAALAYPALPSTVTAGKLALPVLPAATHGKGVSRSALMYHVVPAGTELSIPTATNRRIIDPTDDGAVAVIINAGTAFDGELRIRT